MAGKTRVLLIGCGGIGTITALNLEASGQCHVTAVLRSNYEIVKERGFSIDSLDHGKVEGYRPSEIRTTIPDLSKETVAPFDYIIVTTKNIPDVPPHLPSLIAPALTPGHSAILLIQNGLNIHIPFATAFPSVPILSGISRMGANELAPGVILEDDPDRLSVGAFPATEGGDSPPSDAAVAAAKRFVELYAVSGKAVVEYNANVKFERWRKLCYNATWNPVCALTGLDTGRLRLVGEKADPFSPVNLLLRPAMREVLRVARADGAVLAADAEAEEKLVEGVVEAEPLEVFCQPSMLQDAKKRRVWEVENLLGDVVRVAADKGVEVPALSAIYALAKGRMWALKEDMGLINKDEEVRKRNEGIQGR